MMLVSWLFYVYSLVSFHSQFTKMPDTHLASSSNYDVLKSCPEKLLSKGADIEHASICLKAMAHPLRLKILCLLMQFEKISVLDLVEAVGTSQSNISQHLSILKEKGLLRCEKEANKVYYCLVDEDLTLLVSSIRKAFCNKDRIIKS